VDERSPNNRAADRSGRGDRVLTRREQKLQTRHRLIGAVLALMEEDRSFTSLSLREVTRHAGVVPNAFYRHFTELEALGLAIVDEVGVTLRRLLRQARERGVPDSEIVRRSVQIYVRYVREHRGHFLFVVRERAGGAGSIRAAIRREIGHFVAEMAADIGSIGLMPHLSAASRLMIAQILVQLMLDAAVDVLDLPTHRPQAEQELVDRLVRHLVVVLLGARSWRDRA
jgi:AcrR family transcriptional regulator